ncbi:MAG: DUF4911 domain-containing protein [Candidatus Firestonebacteria bacterium]|nr:DUF4911 domain-containing protein [Candidatus Firestonebacteria bacterium]
MNKINTITKCYKVPKDEICFINSILDSYEGMATLRTLDQNKGYIELWISPFFENEVENILLDLRKEIPIQLISNLDLPDNI